MLLQCFRNLAAKAALSVRTGFHRQIIHRLPYGGEAVGFPFLFRKPGEQLLYIVLRKRLQGIIIHPDLNGAVA